MLPDFPSVLYHYTSTDGLIGIVRNQQLWATDIEYLNDSEELTHVSTELTGRIDSKIMSLGGAQIKNDREDPRSSQILVLLKLREYIGFVQAHENEERAYITCFCEKDDLLSQWRGYAGAGGYALGFNSLKLDPVQSDGLFTPRMMRVLYGAVQAREALDEVVTKLASSPTAHPGVQAWYEEINVLRVLATVKNPGFAEEREWRTVTTSHYNKRKYGAAAFAPEKEHFRLEFRSGGLGIVPYVARKFPAEALVSVTIGPGGDNLLRRRALIQLIEESLPAEVASTVEIRVSKVPFR